MAKDPSKLFDFIYIFFNDDLTYDSLKSYEKARHHFMVNRFFAIKYPEQAQMFNVMGIDSAGVVDCWHIVARQFNKTPGWIFTRVRKTEKQKKKEFNPPEEVMEKYMHYNEIGKREFEEALKFDEDRVKKDFKKLQKQMNTHGNQY